MVIRLCGCAGVGKMKSKSLQPAKRDISVTTEVSNKMKWAEFIADVCFKSWVLLLATIALLGAIGVVWTVIWYDKDPTGAIVGAVIAGAMAGLGKLYQVVVKRRLDAGNE